MSSTPRIFLDLDGVIVNFHLPVMNRYDAKMDSEADYPHEYLWDIVGATNKLRDEWDGTPLTPAQFWDPLPFSFWKGLEMYEYADHFISMLEEIGDVHLATSTTKSTSCVAGKYSWIKANLPRFRKKFFIGASKHALAHSNAILIDDRDKNCEDFVVAGGRAILVPRPWNKLGHLTYGHPYDWVMDHLRDMLGIKRCN
jgi:5'(3')-deoxyribonucleotidase